MQYTSCRKTRPCSHATTSLHTKGHLQPCRSQCGGSAQLPAHVAQAAASSSSSSSSVELPGPQNAFVPGQESESRKQLFNRISPVYDEVSYLVHKAALKLRYC